ncbi:MAG: glycosyltransferase family 2 protein, partial [Winogradskyella arenosi]
MLISIGIYFFYVFFNDFEKFNADRRSTTLGLTFMTVALGLFIYKAAFFIYTIYNYFKYKPVASVSDKELPTVTVIVPAYNEGKQVWDTLMSLEASNYPKEKLQILS